MLKIEMPARSMQMARERLCDYFMTLNVPSFIRPVFYPHEGFDGFFRKRLRMMFGVIQATLPHRVTAFPDDTDSVIGQYTLSRRLMRFFVENVVRASTVFQRDNAEILKILLRRNSSLHTVSGPGPMPTPPNLKFLQRYPV